MLHPLIALARLGLTATLAALLALLPTLAIAAPPTLVVLGDSLSAGYGIRQEAAWPALLAARLKAEGRDYNVVNASISGETTSGGRSRIGELLRRHQPRVVVLALGANDGLRGLPPAQMRDNLAATIDAARSARARVLLVGMRLPPNYGAYADEFHAVFGDLARARRIAHLPFLLAALGTDNRLFQADQLHPTAEAQPLILDTVWPALRPLLD